MRFQLPGEPQNTSPPHKSPLLPIPAPSHTKTKLGDETSADNAQADAWAR